MDLKYELLRKTSAANTVKFHAQGSIPFPLQQKKVILLGKLS